MKAKDTRIIYDQKGLSVRVERCYEPIASCLTRMLIVPKIYFERNWPGEGDSRIDIIAVDRAGTGDIHVVEVKPSLNVALTKGVEFLRNIPAHYRWVVYQGEGLRPSDDEAELNLSSEEFLYPEEGMGRIGVIEVVKIYGNDLGARIRVKAERFKPEHIWHLIEEFVKREEADIEFKE